MELDIKRFFGSMIRICFDGIYGCSIHITSPWL